MQQNEGMCTLLSLLFSCSVVTNSLWPHELQHTRLPCPSLTPGVCSDCCPLSWWCHPTISSCVTSFSSNHQSFPSIRVFSNELAFHLRWPSYWSFSISPSNEYSGLISFRIDWLDLAVQGTLSQESSPTPHFKSINSLALSLHSSTLTYIHDHRKNHSLD